MHINSINNNYNINFKSRNAEIRLADDIARKVNQEFPRISSTTMLGFKNINQYRKLHGRFKSKIEKMRYAKQTAFYTARTFSQKLLAITSNIKAHKLGNCGESAQLAEIAARANGIEDCSCVLVTGNLNDLHRYNFDHTVVLVKNSGKPYIIDSWLGFADYIPEAIKRYQKNFRMHFDFEKCINEKMYFDESLTYDLTGDIFSKKYSVEKLKKLYPELILKRSASKKNINNNPSSFWEKVCTLRTK